MICKVVGRPKQQPLNSADPFGIGVDQRIIEHQRQRPLRCQNFREPNARQQRDLLLGPPDNSSKGSVSCSDWIPRISSPSPASST